MVCVQGETLSSLAKKCFQSPLQLRTISLTIKPHEARRAVNGWQVSACLRGKFAQTQEPPHPQCTAAGSWLCNIPISDANWTRNEHLQRWSHQILLAGHTASEPRHSGFWCPVAPISPQRWSVDRKVSFLAAFWLLLQPLQPSHKHLGFHGSRHHPPNKCPSKFPRWKVFLQLVPRARVTDAVTWLPHKWLLGVFFPTVQEVPHPLCPFLLIPLTFKSF